MELQEVYKRLCYYDKRNPDGCYYNDYLEEEDCIKSDPCYCDNCFYGRNELALIIIKLMTEIGNLTNK